MKKNSHGGVREPGPGKKLGRPPSDNAMPSILRVRMPAEELVQAQLKAGERNLSAIVRELIAAWVRS
jgi:hypothetical protein